MLSIHNKPSSSVFSFKFNSLIELLSQTRFHNFLFVLKSNECNWLFPHHTLSNAEQPSTWSSVSFPFCEYTSFNSMQSLKSRFPHKPSFESKSTVNTLLLLLESVQLTPRVSDPSWYVHVDGSFRLYFLFIFVPFFTPASSFCSRNETTFS